MPHPDGRRTLQAIRERERWRELPVILLTAHDSEEALVEGMSGYLGKPIQELEGVRLLSRYLKLRPLVAPPGAPTAEELPSRLRALEGLRRASGNASLYLDLLHSFKNEYADAVSRLREMGADEASKLLHSLRGNGASIGATDLAMEAGHLEIALRRWEPLVLDSFTRILEETISEIDVYQAASAPSLTPPGAENAVSVAHRLEELLRANDLSATDCYRELKALIGQAPPPSLLELGRAVEQLDFETARTQLRKVEAELGLLQDRKH
jgi:CheY-like chemotaxis protein